MMPSGGTTDITIDTNGPDGTFQIGIYMGTTNQMPLIFRHGQQLLCVRGIIVYRSSGGISSSLLLLFRGIPSSLWNECRCSGGGMIVG